MKRVLILGNGISRLEFHDRIEAWDGEVWGCNYVYKDYAHKLTRLTGEVPKMYEGLKYRDDHGHTYELWGGNLGRPPEGSKLWTCPREFWNDSGTSSVAQALHEGHHVEAVGFDMGGSDCYYHTHYRKNKARWLERWAEIIKHYGPHRVTFWGYNHMPLIQQIIKGKADSNVYQRIYRSGQPHIPDETYVAILEKRHIEHHTGLVEEVPAIVKKIRVKHGLHPVPQEVYTEVQTQRIRIMDEKMVNVRFTNGFRSLLRESVAKRMAEKGELTIIAAKDAKKEAPPQAEPARVESEPEPQEEKPKRTYTRRTVKAKEPVEA